MSAKAGVAGQMVFLDTNIFVYDNDRRDPAKQAVARHLIAETIESGKGAISSQVVAEFCNVALSKFKSAISPADANDYLRITLARLWRHTPSLSFYQSAIELYVKESLSFYDALIVQAAIDLGCQAIYSEDLQAGREYSGVGVVDPFVGVASSAKKR